MSGFNENFLTGIRLPLPTYSRDLEEELLKNVVSLRSGVYADYLYYTLAMNCSKEKRSPIFVACNIDQNLYKKTKRKDNWRIDSRVGFENQLDNAYYKNNDWDRGHISRRNSAGWGTSVQEAQRGSDETFYYTNCCLQHKNYNQDEWLALEDWVHELSLDEDGKLSVFAGPVYGQNDRTVKPSGQSIALVPCAFWKIVCFRNKDSGKLDVRAFIMYQDEAAISRSDDKKKFNNQIYQATVMEIEQTTGLIFEDSVYEANPVYYYSENAHADLNVIHTPELIEVSSSSEIVNAGDKRQTVSDDIVDIFICAAMVDPKGADKKNEWISFANLGSEPIDLNNWTVQDKNNRSLTLTPQLLGGSSTLKPGESKVICPINPLQLGNNGGVIKLYDSNSCRIDWVNYTKKMVVTGKPILFLSPRDTLDI